MIRLPPSTLPVKQTFATSVFWIRPAMFASAPVTTLSTPGGQLLGDALHDARRRQRRRGRRLDDRGVAGQQRVRERGAEDRDRPVERHDDGDDAERLVRRRSSRPGCPGTTGSTLPVSTSSASIEREVPADLEDERVDPGLEADLAVLLRQDRGVLVAVVGDALDRGGHLRGALAAAVSADHAGNAAFAAATASATSCCGRGRRVADDHARLARVGDRRASSVGLPLLAADVQPGPDCLQRFSHDDQAPLCVLSSVDGHRSACP